MGLNNEHAMRICFDIETAPLPEAADYLVEPIEAPSNYKDMAKIAAYIEEKKAKQIDTCSLDPDLCRIVAVGMQVEDDREVYSVAAEAGKDEAAIIQWLWSHAEGKHLVGFNCIAFDLPVLLRRSLYLGIPAPLIFIDKYRHPDVTDLQQLLSFNGSMPWHGLDFYAKRLGCPVADTMDGSGIGLAVKEGRWDDIEAHVKADVQKTAFVAEKCGYFRPAPVAVF